MTDSGLEDDSQLPPPTAPTILSVSLQGFASPEDAERFGNVMAGIVKHISRYIDLERLDGITVAFDYDDALAKLDRGVKPSRQLRRTKDGHDCGLGMAPAVLRDGVVKAHMLFWAPTVLALEDSTSKNFLNAFNIVAHECGHVQDMKNRDLCFPGIFLRYTPLNQEEMALERFAGDFWDEYAACRASAVFGEEQASFYEKSFLEALKDARERANAAIRLYRVHRSVDRVLEEAATPLCMPLRYASCFFGHLDERNMSLDEFPRVRDLLSVNFYESFMNRLKDVLRNLWSRRGHWASISEFDPLRSIVRDLLADLGMFFRLLPDGRLYVDIPFKPETMPR